MTDLYHKDSMITYAEPDISMNLKSLIESSGDVSAISPSALGLLSSSNLGTSLIKSKSRSRSRS